ncbi:MAG: magnesium transporter, partial [Thermodesulfobacteriota bacterium]
EVARLFERYDLISAAVVDTNGKLLGRITIDDVVDIIRDEGEQHMMNMAGLSEDEDLFGPVTKTSRDRSLWLIFNLVAAFFASWVIGLFEARIEKLVALAVLLPVVASLAGNVGNQALTVVIRGLATGQISSGNRGDLFRKELMVGLTNGLMFAVLVGGVVFMWFNNWLLGFVIALAVALNLLTAAGLGSTIPLILKRFGVDPPLAGSVLLTATMDMLGYFVFLGLASIILF